MHFYPCPHNDGIVILSLIKKNIRISTKQGIRFHLTMFGAATPFDSILRIPLRMTLMSEIAYVHRHTASPSRHTERSVSEVELRSSARHSLAVSWMGNEKNY